MCKLTFTAYSSKLQTFIHRCCLTHLIPVVLVHCATVSHPQPKSSVTKVPYIQVHHLGQRAFLVSALGTQRAANCVESVAF